MAAWERNDENWLRKVEKGWEYGDGEGWLKDVEQCELSFGKF